MKQILNLSRYLSGQILILTALLLSSALAFPQGSADSLRLRASSDRNKTVSMFLSADGDTLYVRNLNGTYTAISPAAPSGGSGVDQTARDTATAAFQWRDVGGYLQQATPNDTVRMQKFALTGTTTVTPHWVNAAGSKYSFYNHSLEAQGGISILPDSTSGYSQLNLYHTTTPTRGFMGGMQHIQWSPRLGKWIQTHSIGSGDVVQPLVGPDSISPVAILYSVRSIDPALPNNVYDIISAIGYDYVSPGVGNHYRGEVGLGIAPPLIGSAISFASPVGYPSVNSIGSFFRSSEDSTNSWLTFRHGNTGVASFEFFRNGNMRWTENDGTHSPFAGKGWEIADMASATTMNQPFFRGGVFQFQAKQSIDADYSYLTIGFDLVNANTTPIRAKSYQVSNSGNNNKVITQWGSVTAVDTTRSPRMEAVYDGTTDNGFYMGTQSVGSQRIIGYGSTQDDIVIGNTYVQGVAVGTAVTGTDLFIGKNRNLQPNFLRFMNSAADEKFKIDSTGNLSVYGKINNLQVGGNTFTYVPQAAITYDATYYGTTLIGKKQSLGQFALWTEATGNEVFWVTNSDSLIVKSPIGRTLTVQNIRIAGNGTPGTGKIPKGTDNLGNWTWQPDTVGGGPPPDSGDTTFIWRVGSAGVAKQDSMIVDASTTISPISEDISNHIIFNVDTAYIETKYGTRLPNGQIFVGDVTGRPSRVTMSGNLTMDNTGVTTIADGAVTLARMAALGNGNFIGRVSAGTGVPEAVSSAGVRTQISVPLFTSIDPGATNLFLKWNDGTNSTDWESAGTFRTSFGLGSVENTALSTWAGTTAITTLGTIGTGTWNATTIADGKIASALTGKTYNGLSLAALSTGFTVAGGTTSKTLTVPLDASVSGTNTGDNAPNSNELDLSAATISQADSGEVPVYRRVNGVGGATQDTLDGIPLVNPANAFGGASKLLNILASDAPSTGQLPTYQSNGTVTWEPAGAIDIGSLSAVTPVAADEIPFADVSNGSIVRKATIEEVHKLYVNDWRKAKGYDYFNEFIQTVATTSPGNDIFATSSGTSAATSATATTATNRPGLVRSTTGTTATGRTSPASAVSAIRLAGGTWVCETAVNVTTLSTVTERFQFVVGFFDGLTAANQTDGVYFLYDEGGVSTGSTAATYWQTATVQNSTRTFNTSLTQTTVNAAQWYKLRVEINAAANSVGFYVDGTLVSTHTANIPTGAGRELGFGWLLIKSVGTTARTVDFDYLMVQNEFTSER